MKEWRNEEIREFVTRFPRRRGDARPPDPAWPKISIVTPSFNQAQFLERTIISVLNQDYPNLEYIIIDGGSTDGSVEIIKKYEQNLAYWVSEKDRGQSDAINKGFLKSTGEILAWLNSDDVYLPGVLTFMVRSFREFPTEDVLYGDTLFIDENDAILRKMKAGRFSRGGLISWTLNLIQLNAFWRRKIFFDSGMLRTKYDYAMDYDLWLRMLKSGARFRHLRGDVACLRIHSASKMIAKPNYAIKECWPVREDVLGPRYTNRFLFTVSYYLHQLEKAIYLAAHNDLPYVMNGIKNRWERRKGILSGGKRLRTRN
jgi:glycosyltransferase involved in cell wall biosynthesis